MAKSVLIVDDSKTLRDLVNITLTGAGYKVFQANDGVEALQVVSTNWNIDAILTDINMPNMDGFELVTELRDVNQVTQGFRVISSFSKLRGRNQDPTHGTSALSSAHRGASCC